MFGMFRHVTVVAAMSSCAVAAAQPPPDLHLELVADIGGGRAMMVRSPHDGSNRLFIVEQRGRIWIWDGDSEQLLATPFLDVEPLVGTGDEQGLLGLVFAPDYVSSGHFYVNYVRDGGAGLDRTVVARFSVSTDPNIADPETAETILEVEQVGHNHNAGDMAFGPMDGYLYIALGDGLGPSDPFDTAQDPGELLGKMLRIVPPTPTTPAQLSDGGPGMTCGLVANYSIPPDNPFFGDPQSCSEIWALGVRHPFRFSFDRRTGDLFFGDIGQNMREEIDFLPAESTGGDNFGWDCFEGTVFHESNAFCDVLPLEDLVDPVIEIEHQPGGDLYSVIGGYVYRGSIEGIDGHYFYAETYSGQIWHTTEESGFVPVPWGTVSLPLAFGEDEEGELYISTLEGLVYRFESIYRSIYDDGFESGDTSAWSFALP